jgi:hypothetical protein
VHKYYVKIILFFVGASNVMAQWSESGSISTLKVYICSVVLAGLRFVSGAGNQENCVETDNPGRVA